MMSLDLLLAIIGFSLVTSVTPGPNNMMLMTSGVNFGLRRTVPHIFGVTFGHGLMVFLVGVGVTEMVKAQPQAVVVLKVMAVGYMLWLAWKIRNAAPPEGEETGGAPFTFLQAVALQWVNPKALAMAMGLMGAYGAKGDVAWVATITAVFCVVNFPSVGLWAVMGEALRGWLQDRARLRLFNATMAVLLLASLLPLLRM